MLMSEAKAITGYCGHARMLLKGGQGGASSTLPVVPHKTRIILLGSSRFHQSPCCVQQDACDEKKGPATGAGRGVWTAELGKVSCAGTALPVGGGGQFCCRLKLFGWASRTRNLRRSSSSLRRGVPSRRGSCAISPPALPALSASGPGSS